jgi:growth factor-regulated tyrosine kinase substrate
MGVDGERSVTFIPLHFLRASYALSALKKKLYDKNPNVQLFALQVLESWVKNCGVLIHEELLASKDYMEELHDIVKQTPNEKVRKKILELIQIWAHAFRGQTKYQAVQVSTFTEVEMKY